MHGIDAAATEHVVWKEAKEYLSKVDPALAAIIKKLGAPKIKVVADPFEALARGILHQQVSAKTADAIAAKLLEKNGGTFPQPGEVMAMGPKALQEVGIPANRAQSLWNLSRAVVDGKIDFEALAKRGDAEVEAELVKLPGIGPWTSEMFLIFHMMRPDVWSATDIGLQKAVKQVFDMENLPTPEEMEKIAEKWRPHRSAAAWYLWTAAGGFTPGLK